MDYTIMFEGSVVIHDAKSFEDAADLFTDFQIGLDDWMSMQNEDYSKLFIHSKQIIEGSY